MRSRPRQHVRKLKTGKKTLVNKGIKKNPVSSYKQKRNGKTFKISAYKRKPRKLGKRIRYTSIGTFQVAHDDQGNFRGSKIIVNKKANKTTNKKTRRRIIDKNLEKTIDEIDTAYFNGEINTKAWINLRKAAKGM